MPQRLRKGSYTSLSDRVALRPRYQHTNAASRLGLLGAGSQRPDGSRAAENGDELAPP